MYRILPFLFALALARGPAAQVDFESSNLPIVVVDTGGDAIPDEPKIPGRLSVIDNGPGQRNFLTDAPTGYDGPIGIEVRGASSQSFPKKQYGIETRDESGENRDVPLLGMPEENDWVLYAPYSDKSLMRNVLAFHMARATGRYASRTRFCEVVLNGEYQGVYVMMEKVKRDRARVDIATLRPEETSGDDLTGGYIVQVDRSDEPGWFSAYEPTVPMPRLPYYQYVEPGGDEVVPEQAAYVREAIAAFEGAMASSAYADPATGYPALIDIGSFVDYVLVTEASRNVDGYRLSTFLHKDKDSNDPRLKAGPLWDFNLGFGNADYMRGAVIEGYHAEEVTGGHGFGIPFWWQTLVRDPTFEAEMVRRWAELRAGPFHSDSLAAFVASTAARLDEAQTRNFERWPVLGRYVWPNAYIGATYADEVDYLTSWLVHRLAWMDAALAVSSEPPEASGAVVTAASPNPARGAVSVTVSVPAPEAVRAEVLDARGRVVAILHDGVLVGTRRLQWAPASVASGVFVLRVEGETVRSVQRVTVVGR